MARSDNSGKEQPAVRIDGSTEVRSMAVQRRTGAICIDKPLFKCAPHWVHIAILFIGDPDTSDAIYAPVFHRAGRRITVEARTGARSLGQDNQRTEYANYPTPFVHCASTAGIVGYVAFDRAGYLGTLTA
jgi:hypothetical protein